MGILERFSLDGRVALVTAGAGPLFGSSLSEGLAEAGATVVTASRNRQANEDYAASLRGLGYDAHGMQCDIADTASIDRLHDEVIERFGKLDILVNAALARDGHVGPFEDQPIEKIEISAAGDFTGLLAICQRFIPDMIEAGGGSIINVSSIFGVVSNDPTMYEGTEMKQPATYTFVKAGMVNFTRYLACYYGKQGVRANCISPGGYYSDHQDPFLSRYESRCPMGRMMDNEDVKGAVVYLASDASSYVTGLNLMVDGGWTCL
ncbi:TPA: short-chain dehydrogenase [Candidatus Latescibacteria bacterium]|nr:short-chain dehydrogenase [Candidatus Latescibacterota bacterium]